MKVINLFGGPNTGKSTALHGLMFRGKIRGLQIECSMEYARELIYDGHIHLLKDGNFVLDEQERRLRRFEDKGLDCVVCEWPFPLVLAYTPDAQYNDIQQRTMQLWSQFDNVNYLFMRRNDVPFKLHGRVQRDESEALEVDARIRRVLHQEHIAHKQVTSSLETIEMILDDIYILGV